jgi:hypothetical protein
VTTVRLDDLGKTTTLESNKSLTEFTRSRIIRWLAIHDRFQLGSLRMIPCAASYSWRLRSYRLRFFWIVPLNFGATF